MIRLTKASLNGTIETSGFFFAEGILDQLTLRMRILKSWRRGMRLYKVPGGFVLLFPKPRLLSTRSSPAAAVQSRDGRYSTLPLSNSQWDKLNMPADFLIFAKQGEIESAQLSGELDPSTWISAESWTVEEGNEVANAPAALLAPELPTVQESRDLFQDARFQASDELSQFLSEQLGKPLRSAGGWRRSLTKKIVQFLESLPGIRLGTSKSSGVSQSNQAQTSSKPGATFFRNLLLKTPVGALFRLRQTRYLKKLAELLEAGEIEQALRNAIPLGGSVSNALPALGLPIPRSLLRINPFSSAGSARVLDLGATVREYLRNRYKRLFEQLDAQGRYKDAAFVLAELLKDEEEAVQYLEKHKMFQLAAELAEGRQLRPALVVRQWIIAGDLERAVRIARLTGAYAQALALLDMRTPAALGLRLIWAHELELRGEYLNAVEALAPLQAQNEKIRQLIERGLTQEDDQAAELLVYRLTRSPDQFEDTRSRIEKILADTSFEHTSVRLRLAQLLIKQPKTVQTKTIARTVLRSHLRDRTEQVLDDQALNLKKLIEYCEDPALKTDVQRLNLSQNQRVPVDINQSRTFELSLNGRLPISDCRLLATGDLLVALGEAGALLLNSAGKVKRRFPEPCTTLVLADGQRRALALASRGSWQRITVLELDSGKSSTWGEIETYCFADSYDGQFWYCAGVNRTVLCFDMLSLSLRPQWSVRDLPGNIFSVSRSVYSLFCVVITDDKKPLFERWRYDLPVRTLRERTATQLEEFKSSTVRNFTIDEVGRLLVLKNAPCVLEYLGYNWFSERLHIPEDSNVLNLCCEKNWIALTIANEFGHEVRLMKSDIPARKFQIVPWTFRQRAQTLPEYSPHSLRVKLCNEKLICWSPEGGIAGIDLVNGRVMFDLGV